MGSSCRRFWRPKMPWQVWPQIDLILLDFTKSDAHFFVFFCSAWAIEYARGPLITILPFGLVSILFDSLDFGTLIKTLWIYAKLNLQCSMFVPGFLKGWRLFWRGLGKWGDGFWEEVALFTILVTFGCQFCAKIKMRLKNERSDVFTKMKTVSQISFNTVSRVSVMATCVALGMEWLVSLIPSHLKTFSKDGVESPKKLMVGFK